MFDNFFGQIWKDDSLLESDQFSLILGSKKLFVTDQIDETVTSLHVLGFITSKNVSRLHGHKISESFIQEATKNLSNCLDGVDVLIDPILKYL